ncbi:response regulator receiver modulated diguanylate cyclase/phosphodiesterase with PAS/PAC sensor(s) [Candidatus Magnetobacterium bavaricum]|uniref:Response regulator receiver modulated diguanylate cyclase/phosphodiesterase with PAS/PAC sensor(S) n=1 Tax=Candidatus Magnetobacterium bavaricum TaxID=29290 RepID=A0A0F3GL94_9BACT|nr:response regulator receiver modulated diguanylate cyclase/phosphodiesterase with PAS/PAC sensor(s) [Candidatus Magnetobacterium bavaricum]
MKGGERIFEMLDNMPLGIFIISKDFTVVFWNKRLQQWTGISKEEITGTNICERFTHLATPLYFNRIRSIFEGWPPTLFSAYLHDYTIQAPLSNGNLRLQNTSVSALSLKLEGEDVYAMFVIQDVTDLITLLKEHKVMNDKVLKDFMLRRQMEESLRENEEKFRSITSCAMDAIIVIDHELHISYWNPAAEEMFGYTNEEIIGSDIYSIFLSSSCSDELLAVIAADSQGQDAKDKKIFQLCGIKKNKTEFPIEVSLSSYLMRDNRSLLGIVRDITQRKEMEQMLQELAHYDTLTSLPNRVLFNMRFGMALEMAKRENRLIAIMFLDLDRFKLVNDTLGHDVGDLLLKEVAQRLQGLLRKSDTVARMGGDEFTIILTAITDELDVTMVAQKVIEIVSQPFHLRGHECSIGTSIGISLYPHDGQTIDTLMGNADTAMYIAKRDSGNAFRLFTPQMNTLAHERVDMEMNLRNAINNKEFLLHYQPQLDIRRDKIVGLEALIRWNQPRLGLLPPMKFISIAEETGLVIPITDWVVRAVCEQIQSWHKQGVPIPRIAINVSGSYLKQGDRIDALERVLEETNLTGECLELELTENVFLNDSGVVLNNLRRLSKMGIYLSIDDFGTGYSSLGYIKYMPISKLKIDASFVRDIPTDTDNVAIVTAITAMAHGLNLRVIAEGVETFKQYEFLRLLRCDEIQGYLLSKPMNPEDCQRHLLNTC